MDFAMGEGRASIAVAIDGPAGAGKSTVARTVAARLGFQYLDTGMMYRAVTRALLDRGTDIADPSSVAVAAQDLDVTVDGERVFVDGIEQTSRIRTPEVTAAVSSVSAVKAVREAMVRIQRNAAKGRDIVMDGRDIASVVLPDAACKIYLDASIEERARRRLADFGWTSDRLPELVEDLRRRDRFDSTRAESPLIRVADAVTVDTTGLQPEDTVNKILEIIRSCRSGQREQ
jgi:cytidylate kinase